jgi:predicted ATPase
MAILHALLAQVEAGRGQVAGVVGEAGIGKSRLISEFCHSLPGRALTYLTGRCFSYGSATPYLPLLDLLRHNCGITEADGPEDITAKVHHSLQEVGMPPETWAPVFLSLLGVQEGIHQLTALSPEARKARVLTACTQLCLNSSRQHPLVLAIEDLHWIDASSEECLMALVERMAGAPLLLLVTSRQGYRPPWIGKSYATQLALTPLDPEGSRRVVQAIRGTISLSEPTLEAILARANGNPLFLEELAHTVVEEATSSRQSVLPTTLQAVLAARIDRLVPEAKWLLQVAAVIGKHIPLPLLQAVVEMPAELLQQHLDHLQSAELLYETTWAAAQTVTFKHVLIQEAACQSLLQETRQQVHRQIAQMLSEYYPQIEETQPEWLAHHYTEAGLSAQAIVYWRRAGQYALDRSAYVEAIAHLRQGLHLTTTLPDTPERLQHELMLYMALGVTLAATQGYAAPDVEHAYLQAHECCRQLGDPAALFTVLRGLWVVYLTRAQLQRAYEQGGHLLRLAQHYQEPPLLLEAHRALGTSCLLLGDLATAWTHLERGLTLDEGQPHRALTLYPGGDAGMACLVYTAWILWLRGYPEQALERIRAALALAHQCQHSFCQAFALLWAAVLSQCQREFQAVSRQAAASMTLAHQQEFPLLMAMGTVFQGWVRAEQGRAAEGIEQIRQGIAAFRATGAELLLPHFLGLLAEAYGRSAYTDKGLEALDEALTLVDRTGERLHEPEFYRLKGQLLLTRSRDHHPEAEEYLHRALTIARHQHAKSWELRAAISLSRLWQQQGKRDAARELLAEVYGWFIEGFDTADLQEAKGLLEELSRAE